MTSDEALIEKMAEAMWATETWRFFAWAEATGDDRDSYLAFARAALSVVRDHDKQQPRVNLFSETDVVEKGLLVHAQSTGAERSSDLSAVVEADLEIVIGDLCEAFNEAALNGDERMKLSSCVGSKFHARIERLANWLLRKPIVDRLAHREPDLPPSLLSRLEDSRGLTRGKRP